MTSKSKQDWERHKKDLRSDSKGYKKTSCTIIGGIMAMTQRMLHGDVHIPELLDWHHDILEGIHRELGTSKTVEGDYAVKWTPNKKVVGSLLDGQFTQYSVVDSYYGDSIRSSRPRPFFRGNWNRSWRRSLHAFRSAFDKGCDERKETD